MHNMPTTVYQKHATSIKPKTATSMKITGMHPTMTGKLTYITKQCNEYKSGLCYNRSVTVTLSVQHV